MSHTQEIRFAIVLYGGVSLAIYINGVVQELFRLARSSSSLPVKQKTSEEIYRKLGQALERGQLPHYPNTDEPIRTKFKIDVISGTSAGGLNGIYLAKALVGDGDISSVQDLWFKEGDISKLLNDKGSYTGLPFAQPNDTESLLNSRRMYYRLLKAFDKMDGAARTKPSSEITTSPLADEIDLFATTTDIEGVPVPIRLFDNIVYERRHRNDFHLRFISGERNDFQADNNPFLAFAARCTSSFPFAFEPMRLCEIDEILEHEEIYATKSYCQSSSSRWEKFFTSYLNLYPENSDHVFPGAVPFPKRSFGDGGYLNNAPFSYAIEALLARQSEVPIDRKLIYVEPSPAHPEEEAVRIDKPDAIENSLAALITIPGYQTVRGDLARILERNRDAAKINKILGEVEAGTQPPDYKGDSPPPEIWFQEERPYRAGYLLRAGDVVDRLAVMVARTLLIDEESVLFIALRSLIRAWRDRAYFDDRGEISRDQEGEFEQHRKVEEFLRRFDLAYRVRRLRFVLRKLDSLYAMQLENPAHPARKEATSARRFALGLDQSDAEAPKKPAEDLEAVWTAIAAEYMRLHQLQRRLTEKPLPEDKHTPAEALFKLDRDDPVERVRGLLRPWRGKVIALLTSIAGMDAKAEPGTARYHLATKPLDRSKDQSRTTEFACDVRAKEVLAEDPDVCCALAELDDGLRDIFADHFAAAHRGAAKAFPRPDKEADAGRIAAQFYEWFDLFEAVQFPMTFGTDIGEPDQVDIIRVCPEDAGLLVPDVGERRTKLKGLVAAHFGAFLDRDWRVSDLLWGRLDGAERIITALLPLNESRDLRERLINEAQAAILEEFGASAALRDMTVRESAALRPGAAPAQTPVQLVAIMNPLPIPPTLSDLQNFMNVWRVIVPRDPKRAGLLETLARGTEITGRILDGIATKKSLPPWGSWAVTAGRALWGLVEISIPRSFGVLLGHYWQSLLLLISIVLIVAGLFGAPGVSALGWTLLLADVAIFALRRSLTGFMSGSAPGSLRTIAALTLLILLGAGGWKIYDLAMAGWTKLQALIG